MSTASPVECSHGKAIAMRVGFVALVGCVAILCTALPLATSTSSSTDDKTKKASGYAWAAFIFELFSILLVFFGAYKMYKCVAEDPSRIHTWGIRCSNDVKRASAAGSAASAVATNISDAASSASSAASAAYAQRYNPGANVTISAPFNARPAPQSSSFANWVDVPVVPPPPVPPPVIPVPPPLPPRPLTQ
jgi:hypothetical protein